MNNRSTRQFAFVASMVLCLIVSRSSAVEGTGAFEGARVVSFHGYEDCIELSNQDVHVVLCPAAGGRVLKYALRGKNALYLPSGSEGWTDDGSGKRGPMHAGRFDIGPEQIVPRRNKLWQGRWQGEVIGDRQARLTSQVDEGPGVQLVRTFTLAQHSSQLECEQEIVSHSDQPVEYCHWSRTFATGKGVCIVPLSGTSRFSESYVRYDPPGKMLNMKPTDPNIVRRGDFLIVSDRPLNPKLGFDSMVGWLAYHTTDDLLFVKKFPTFPDRVYNEVAGLTISIWYPDDEMVELEPIGPRERLKHRGSRAAFTETWYLVDHRFPAESADPERVAEIVSELP